MNDTWKKTSLVLTMLLVGILFLVGCGSDSARPPANQNEVPRITAEDLKSRIDSGKEILIVDSRSADSYAQLHVAGAISIPVSEVESRLDELPKDQEIAFYCT